MKTPRRICLGIFLIFLGPKDKQLCWTEKAYHCGSKEPKVHKEAFCFSVLWRLTEFDTKLQWSLALYIETHGCCCCYIDNANKKEPSGILVNTWLAAFCFLIIQSGHHHISEMWDISELENVKHPITSIIDVLPNKKITRGLCTKH